MSSSTARTPKDGAVWRVLGEHLDRLATDCGPADLSILDIGGGTGVYAVPLAERGHHVTVIEPSPDALATLRRRAQAANVTEQVTAISGDADNLAEHGLTADVVLCHHILEYVDDPQQTMHNAVAALQPGGLLSIVIQLRAGAVLARALTGRAHEARAILADPNGRVGAADPVLRRLDADALIEMLDAAGLAVVHFAGVDILGALADNTLESQRGGAAASLESFIAPLSPYRDVAPNAHLIAVRKDS